MATKWCVSMQAEGDRVMGHDEIVALADAVAGLGGVASGIGTMGFGAQVVVEAPNQDAALELGLEHFAVAVETAGLPSWPVTWAEVECDDEFGGAW